MKTKKCIECGEIKELNDFHKRSGSKDGYQNKCKECIKKYRSKYHEQNKEYENERNRQYYKDNIDSIKNKHSQYYKDNKEARKEYNAKFLKDNPEYYSKYKKENSEKYKALNANRRAMKRALPHYNDSKKWIEILELFNNKCAVTGKSKPVLEHFIPLSTGHGGTIEGNIYPLHGSLNGRKSSKNPFEFMKELDGKQQEKFKEVIRYLAELNGMTYIEFHKYVNWCFKNKRTIEQIQHDNELGLTSIDLYYLSFDKKSNQ